MLWSWAAGGFSSEFCYQSPKPFFPDPSSELERFLSIVYGCFLQNFTNILLTSVDRMGSPKELFGTKGIFYDMVQHSGEVKELQGVFGDSD